MVEVVVLEGVDIVKNENSLSIDRLKLNDACENMLVTLFMKPG